MPSGTKEVTFYISPHPDDWMLFMVPRAAADLDRPTAQCKVVFLYFTAGDAGRIADENEFWRGREMGSINAVRSLRGLRKDTKVATTVDTICGHPVVTVRTLENTVSYYLRLPESSLFSVPADPSAPLPPRQELRPLGQSTDKFGTWNDLVGTVAQILRNESYGTEKRPFSWVNYLDPLYSEHINHTVVGKCIEEAMDLTSSDKDADKVRFEREKYLDYRIAAFPRNVSGRVLSAKKRMFQTYDRVANFVSNGRYPSHQYGEYLNWLMRQYTVAKAKEDGMIS